MLHSGLGSELSRLTLIKDMHVAVADDDAWRLVDRAIDELAQGKIDDIIGDDDAEQASSLLMDFVYPEWPDGLAQKAREILTAKIARMLEQNGNFLSLEALKLVSDRLFVFGTSEDKAGEASRAAVAAQLKDLDETLSNISSLDELDTFESELKGLVERYRVTHPRMTWRLRDCREKLEEQEQQAYDKGSGWRPRPSPGWISNDDIRCLFGTLR